MCRKRVACKLIYEPFPGSSGGGVRVKHSSHAISLHPMTISVSMSTYRFRLRGRVNFGLITVHGRWKDFFQGEPKVVRFAFYRSKLKKTISFAEIFNLAPPAPLPTPMYSNETKIHPASKTEARSGHGY